MEQSHSHSNMVNNYQSLASIIKPELLLLWEVINYVIIFSGIGLPQFQVVNFQNMYQDEKKKKFVISFILMYFYLICFIFLWMSITGWAVSPVSGTRLKTKSLSQNSKVLSELKDPLDLFMLGLFLFFFKRLFIYLFIFVVLVICCCGWALSSCSEWGLLFAVVHRLFIAEAALLAEHGSRHTGFSSYSMWAR